MATLGIELFGLLFCGVSVCHELLISGIEGRTDRITYCFKGMNKNRVVNYRKLLEISTLLYCERGNTAENEAGKFKVYVILNFPAMDILVCKIKEQDKGNSVANKAGKFKVYVILNFPTLDFHIRKIKEREFQKKFCRSLPYFYTYPDCLIITEVQYIHETMLKNRC